MSLVLSAEEMKELSDEMIMKLRAIGIVVVVEDKEKENEL